MNRVIEEQDSRPLLILKGSLLAILIFAAFGTISALWQNPFFIRMTPTTGFEISLLAIQAILFGIYFSIPTDYCSTKTLSTGGVMGFLGVACPVCNKILLYLFGAELLLAYLEPARIYLAAIGTLIVGMALYIKLEKRRARPRQTQAD